MQASPEMTPSLYHRQYQAIVFSPCFGNALDLWETEFPETTSLEIRSIERLSYLVRENCALFLSLQNNVQLTVKIPTFYLRVTGLDFQLLLLTQVLQCGPWETVMMAQTMQCLPPT